MGTTPHKDKNVDIYLQTINDHHTAGDLLQGSIYINCHSPSPYSTLYLKLQTYEESYWDEQRTQSYNGEQHSASISHCNKVCSYSDGVVVAEFGGVGLKQGQYAFPFRMLLPEGLPGTFRESRKEHPQTFEISLNVDQPLRQPFGPSTITKLNTPQCCGCCCCSYGTVRISLTCDKNAIHSGDPITITAVIDNTSGTKPIKKIRFNFQRHLTLIARDSQQKTQPKDKLTLYSSEKQIPAGSHDTITFTTSIPAQYCNKSTAIGTIISNFYTLEIESSMGCCSIAADSRVHVVYYSGARKLQLNKRIEPPVNWNPRVAGMVSLVNFRPYVYRPQAMLMYYNRKDLVGIQNTYNLQNMESAGNLNNNYNYNNEYRQQYV